jgi:hypothetical protein
MFTRKLHALGIGAVAAAILACTASTVKAEPYGGFDKVERKYIRIDYGPRYVPQSTTVRYADPPGYGTYQRGYSEPAYQTTTVVERTPVVEYAAPVRYRRVYAAPRRVLNVSPIVRYGGYRYPRSVVRHHNYPRRILSPFGPRAFYRPYRHVRHHPRGWGFSVGLGRGYYGHRGGFSFHYNR